MKTRQSSPACDEPAGRNPPIDLNVLVEIPTLHPIYSGIRSYRELPPLICNQISHFFQHYKDLEPGKWVSIARWLDVEEAQALVMKAIARAKAAQSAEPR